MQEAENQEDIAKAFEEVSEDLGYKVKVIYTDPSNSPQLIGIDKEIKNIFKSTDEEYITKEEKRNAEKILEKESVLHNFIKTKDGIKIVISDSLRNIKKVDYETGKEVVISKSNKIVKDYMNQGTSNNYTYGFNNPKSDEGKFDKGLHFLSDIVNYIFEGMGVQDETTIRERINMSILGG